MKLQHALTKSKKINKKRKNINKININKKQLGKLKRNDSPFNDFHLKTKIEINDNLRAKTV